MLTARRLRMALQLVTTRLIDVPMMFLQGILRPLGPLLSAIMKTDQTGMIKVTPTNTLGLDPIRTIVLGPQAKTLPAQLPSDRMRLAQDTQVTNFPLPLLVPYDLTFLPHQDPKDTILFNHLLMGEMSMPLTMISGTQGPTAIHLTVT